MNKWIAIPVIVVLSLGVIVGGYFLWQQTNKLGETESEIVALEDNVSTLEGNVSTLEGNVSTLEGELTDSQATVATLEGNISTLEGNVFTLQGKLADSQARASTLETDLQAANDEIVNLQADLKTQQTLNLALSEELKTVKDPRHFESLAELTDWLREDDTDTKYPDAGGGERAFILQVRALRDGYILPVTVWTEDGVLKVANLAAIGDKMYHVRAIDDYIDEWYSGQQPVPSHPLPLD